MLLDGSDQIRVPASLGKPCGFLARRAAVALYDLNWVEASAQVIEDGLDVGVGPAEAR